MKAIYGAWPQRLAVQLGLLSVFFLVAFPFVWYALTSLKSRRELAKNPFGWPEDPQWSNFVDAWEVGRLAIYFPNSIIYTLSIVTGVCILASLAGYSIAHYRFIGRAAILIVMVMGLALPFQAIMVPMYFLVDFIGILGTRLGLIFPVIAMQLPFGVFFMAAFYQSIPDEIAEAARCDGANEWQTFRKIMLPLSWPAVTTLALFQFMWAWTLFLPALVLVPTDSLRPSALAVVLFTGKFSSERGLMAAGVLITIAPVILIYVIGQRKFIAGLTVGALK